MRFTLVRTEKTFVNNPYHKAFVSFGLVGSGVFIFIQLARIVTGGYYSVEETSDPIPENLPEPNIFDDEPQVSNNDLEIHQALRRQSEEIEQVEQLTPKVTPSPPSPSKASAPITPAKISQNPAPAPRPTPVQQVSYTPVVKPAVSPTQALVAEEKKLDPMEQWLLAANMGSYGSTNLDQPVANNYAAGNYTPPPQPSQVIPVNYRQGRQTETKEENPNLYVSDQPKLYSSLSQNEFKRGTTVEGEIDLPIIWMLEADSLNQQRDYLIKIKSPLLGADGQEIVPEGSLAVVKAQEFYGRTGFIQLEVTSIIIEQEGQTQEHSIPPNSLIVLNKKGGLLQAKAKKANNLKGDAAALLLSGISTAASVLNNPTETRTTAFERTTSFGGDGDFVSGFIEGAADSAVGSIRQRQNLARSNSQGEPTVYLIDAGTKVRLIVNKSFSLQK